MEDFPLYTHLSWDGKGFLIPQSDIHILESIHDVTMGEMPSPSIGWIASENTHWPVYAMNDQLRWLDNIPASRRVCVVIHHENNYVGLLCDQVKAVEYEQLNFHTMPVCMQQSNSLIQTLAIYKEEIACVLLASEIISELTS